MTYDPPAPAIYTLIAAAITADSVLGVGGDHAVSLQKLPATGEDDPVVYLGVSNPYLGLSVEPTGGESLGNSIWSRDVEIKVKICYDCEPPITAREKVEAMLTRVQDVIDGLDGGLLSTGQQFILHEAPAQISTRQPTKSKTTVFGTYSVTGYAMRVQAG